MLEVVGIPQVPSSTDQCSSLTKQNDCVEERNHHLWLSPSDVQLHFLNYGFCQKDYMDKANEV